MLSAREIIIEAAGRVMNDRNVITDLSGATRHIQQDALTVLTNAEHHTAASHFRVDPSEVNLRLGQTREACRRLHSYLNLVDAAVKPLLEALRRIRNIKDQIPFDAADAASECVRIAREALAK